MIAKKFRIYALTACIGIVLPVIVYFGLFPPCFHEGANSPEGTVETYYKYLNAGEYSKARELHSIDIIGQEYEVKLLEDDPERAVERTKNGSIDKVKIVRSRKFRSRMRFSNYAEELAEVHYDIVYKDGSSLGTLFITLVKENGCWLLR